MLKYTRVFFIDKLLIASAAAVVLSVFVPAGYAFAQDDVPDATAAAAAPKIYTEQEISSFDIVKLKDIAAADSIDQKSPLALYCLAQKYKTSGDIKTAEGSFKQLIQTYPKHYLAPKACLELASIFSQEKRESEEIEILNSLSSGYPEYSENITALYKSAQIMKKRKNIDEMYKKLAEAETLFAGKPEVIPVLFMSANEYLRNYNTKKALEKFENLLKIKELTISQRAQAMLGKAASYEYNAEPEKAMMIYDEILKTRELDKSILEMADKSKVNLSKAPKSPLVKMDELRSADAAGTTESGLRISPAAGTAESGLRQIPPSTSEVKVRITD
jgi:tetratricopeptide (TPR) repeat protein